ncbi:MAG: glutamate-1-semialdehyde 2,1-aminomutase [Oligoflexia bacterium]|nr:glutamate-1-semialdehyde 2,1-aminomutase [Oligoflexia bacterium]
MNGVCAMTSYFERSLKVVPGGVHSPVRSFKGLHTSPLFIERAEGGCLYDTDGKSYIDFCMSFGPLILGHKDPEVEESLRLALGKGWTYGASERYSLELAEYIVERIPFVQQIRFVNSGTEAVMTALRLARGYTGRDKVIKFSGCYHGHCDSMLIKAGSGVASLAEASSLGVPLGVTQDTYVLELGDTRRLTQLFDEQGTKIAAVIIEPLPANNGLLIQDPQFLRELVNHTKRFGALLIFDEVISGFRTGFGGMSSALGINPDLVTYGKIIGGGLPVGAVGGKHEIMQMLAPVGDVYQAGTLSANPLAMVAGLATLKKLNVDFYARLDKYSNAIVELFRRALLPRIVSEIISYRSLFWIKSTNFYELFQRTLQQGIYLAPSACEVGFVSGAHCCDKVMESLEQKLRW